MSRHSTPFFPSLPRPSASFSTRSSSTAWRPIARSTSPTGCTRPRPESTRSSPGCCPRSRSWSRVPARRAALEDSARVRKSSHIASPITPLIELQAELERLMQRMGLEPEGRKFTPHVTLARLRDSSSRQVADYLSTRAPVRVSPFPVSRFVLFSSKNSVGGGPYVVEAAYPLAA